MIERSQQDGICTLRLAHGKANALDRELVDGLAAELAAIGDDVRAIVLTGTGSIFSAGVDLVRLVEGGAEYVREFLPRLGQCLQGLFTLPRPVVAAINGHAIAGGAVMALAADYRVMAEGGGRIGLPELFVGVPFPVEALEIIRFAVPRERVQGLIYAGHSLPASEAREAGLIDELAPASTLLARAQETAARLAEIPPAVFCQTKRMLRADSVGRMEHGRASYSREILEQWSSEPTMAHLREYVRRTLGK